MAKVVLVDNFDRGYVDDFLYKKDLTDEQAQKIADEYNESVGDYDPWYAVVRADNYRLKTFSEDW